MIKIITKYDYENRVSPGINFSPQTVPADRSKTVQSDMDAADINKIMARYEKTGVLIDDLGNERQPVYGDFTEVKNYHEMMIAIRNVEHVFELLPAKIKNKFNNDPQQLIDFLENPQNDAEAVELGLKDKSVLPIRETWDVKNSKWINSADGTVMPIQKAPPAAPAGAAAAGAAAAGGL